MKFLQTYLFLTSVLLFISGGIFAQEDAQLFDYGSIADSVYTNSFFGMEIDIPGGWIVQSEQQNREIMAIGKKMVAGDDEMLKTALDVSEVNTATLLTVFQYEVGSPVPFNPSFMVIAENLKLAPGIKSGEDYLYHTKRVMEQAAINYTFDSDTFDPVTLSDKDFYKMRATITHLGNSIHQEYYSMVMNGFAFNLIISYADEEQKAMLEEVLASLKFTSKE